MSSDPREAIALLRYRIVAAATDPRLTPAERGQLVRELAAHAYDHPDGSRYTYSRGTLDRLVRAYREQGLDGLRPPPRADLGTVRRQPALLEEACQLRKELPARSAAQIAAILKARNGVRIPSAPFVLTSASRVSTARRWLSNHVRLDASKPNGRTSAGSATYWWVRSCHTRAPKAARKAASLCLSTTSAGCSSMVVGCPIRTHALVRRCCARPSSAAASLLCCTSIMPTSGLCRSQLGSEIKQG
jgi:hypothetical protein